jgi:3-oxoacyl-[acyl-carrier-protein] synthase-3
MSVGIKGSGLFVPHRVVTNHDLVAAGMRTSHEWIVEHTGIHARRIAAAEEATSDLAVGAARDAIDQAGISPSEIRMIVCATSTPDHTLPSTAGLVQDRLGVTGAGAFDLNAGCSGFAYALNVGFALQQNLSEGYVLVVAADTYSRFLDWDDRSSAMFFGDGAGAVVLGPSSRNWMLASYCGSDGSGSKHITIPAGGSRLPATECRVREKLTQFHMNGKEVWSFVRGLLPEMIHEVTRRAGLRVADIKLFIPHQANERLLLACIGDLGIERERMLLNVDRYGNTGSASAAIGLAEAVASGRLSPGDIVVLAGFGAGLAWSSSCLEWGSA